MWKGNKSLKNIVNIIAKSVYVYYIVCHGFIQDVFTSQDMFHYKEDEAPVGGNSNSRQLQLEATPTRDNSS